MVARSSRVVHWRCRRCAIVSCQHRTDWRPDTRSTVTGALWNSARDFRHRGSLIDVPLSMNCHDNEVRSRQQQLAILAACGSDTGVVSMRCSDRVLLKSLTTRHDWTSVALMEARHLRRFGRTIDDVACRVVRCSKRFYRMHLVEERMSVTCARGATMRLLRLRAASTLSLKSRSCETRNGGPRNWRASHAYAASVCWDARSLFASTMHCVPVRKVGASLVRPINSWSSNRHSPGHSTGKSGSEPVL